MLSATGIVYSTYRIGPRTDPCGTHKSQVLHLTFHRQHERYVTLSRIQTRLGPCLWYRNDLKVWVSMPSAILLNLQFPHSLPSPGGENPIHPLVFPDIFLLFGPGVYSWSKPMTCAKGIYQTIKAAKNLNVTNFFTTKQQVGPPVSLNLMVLPLGI